MPLTESLFHGTPSFPQDEFEDAPLHDAIEKDNKEAIDVLVDTPSQKLSLQNRKGFNMLQLACLRGCV